MVDFDWFRSFVFIYKYQSVSEAAKARMMTQPAMSQHLAALEAEAGELLFTRTPRKMIPTVRGKELYTRVAPLIEALEETANQFKAPLLTELPAIKIGTAHEFFREYIAPHLDRYPMRVLAHYGVASDLIEMLLEDRLDLIVTSEKSPASGIEHVHYMQEQFVVAAPYGLTEPGLDDPNNLEAWLSSQAWLSYGFELPIIRRFWRAHFHKRPQIQPVHVLPDLHSILAAIECGAGISLLPIYMLHGALQANKVKIVAEPFKVANDMYFAYKIKYRNSPVVRLLIEEMSKRAASPAE